MHFHLKSVKTIVVFSDLILPNAHNLAKLSKQKNNLQNIYDTIKLKKNTREKTNTVK